MSVYYRPPNFFEVTDMTLASPRVVITAAEFPDPRLLSYDLLFQRVLRHLDLYGMSTSTSDSKLPSLERFCAVESDYTVVFLVAGGKYAPGWSWVWKSYRGLSRKCVIL